MIEQTLRHWLWYPTNGIFRMLEAGYQRLYRLEPVGELLLLQRRTYQGPPRRLDDTTELLCGQPLAIIHFNNSALAEAQTASGGRHGGFVFARLLFEALHDLADRVERDPAFAQVTGFRGVTWIPPHGRRIGFEIQPLPQSWRTRMLAWHFRCLLYAFNPQASSRERGPLRPHEFWMSRQQLLNNFGSGRRPR